MALVIPLVSGSRGPGSSSGWGSLLFGLKQDTLLSHCFSPARSRK